MGSLANFLAIGFAMVQKNPHISTNLYASTTMKTELHVKQMCQKGMN